MNDNVDSVSAAIDRIQIDMEQIASGREDPYKAGWRIWGEAFALAAESGELLWPMWLQWGALTDWVELKPSEAEQANDAMRRAAREWLIVADDPSRHRSYFERWLYEELGCPRPAAQSADSGTAS